MKKVCGDTLRVKHIFQYKILFISTFFKESEVEIIFLRTIGIFIDMTQNFWYKNVQFSNKNPVEIINF